MSYLTPRSNAYYFNMSIVEGGSECVTRMNKLLNLQILNTDSMKPIEIVGYNDSTAIDLD
jgi:hypothetical protein